MSERTHGTHGDWSDSRLDTAYREIRAEIALLRTQIGGMDDKIDKQISLLEDKLVAYREEQRHEEERRLAERKADFHWIVATIIATAGVLLAAIGVIIGTN